MPKNIKTYGRGVVVLTLAQARDRDGCGTLGFTFGDVVGSSCGWQGEAQAEGHMTPNLVEAVFCSAPVPWCTTAPVPHCPQCQCSTAAVLQCLSAPFHNAPVLQCSSAPVP